MEKSVSIHPKTAGSILLVQVKSLPDGVKVLVSNNRIIYYTFQAGMCIVYYINVVFYLIMLQYRTFNLILDSEVVSSVIQEWFFEETALMNKVTSIISPQKFQNDEDNTNRMRASLGYDVIFTVINSDPENVRFQWNVKKEVTGRVIGTQF